MIGSPRPYIFNILAVSAAAGLLVGCQGAYKKWSDREVFGILKNKSSRVPNADDSLLSISPPTAANLDKLARNTKTEEFLGERAVIEKDARVLTLANTLGYAVERNRPYLSQKELVYLAALDLTLTRHEFAFIPHAEGEGTHLYRNVEKTVTLPAPLTPTGAQAVVPKTVNTWVTEHTLTASGNVGFSMLGRAGTRLAADLTTDFLKFITGNSKGVSNSKLAASLSQPILRGAGSLTVMEPLTQAERDVLYKVRTFTQFRKSFIIDTVSKFFGALRSRDEARNSYLVYKSFKGMLEAQEALVDANKPGRTKSALGLLKQAQLNYERRWIAAVQGYEEDLDDLKIHLGLPVNEKIILDDGELQKLAIIDPPGSLDEAMATALDTRLDLWNAKNNLEDAERHVKVAEHDLLPGLGLKAEYNLAGDKDDDGLSLNQKRRNYSVGLDVDLHLDQKPARNALRTAQVELQRAQREFELAQENVRKDIRTDWRNLDVVRKQHEIAERALKLGEGRMELEQALYAADRGTSRDLIDAQTALIDARNQIIAAQINHTIARMTLFKDMGVLFIRKDGSWEDVLKKESPKGTNR